MFLCRAGVAAFWQPGGLAVIAFVAQFTVPVSADAGTKAPKVSVAPVISGTPRVARTLTVSTGVWKGATTSTSYAWYRCSKTTAIASKKPSGCLVIPGATDTQYTLTAADLEKYLTASVTVLNGSLGAVSWAASTKTKVVAEFLLPVNKVAPALTGDLFVTEQLSVSNGTWQEGPDSYEIQWNRCATMPVFSGTSIPSNCVAIAGATSQNYLLGQADVGAYIFARVTAVNAAGRVTKFSNVSGQISIIPMPEILWLPSVSGSQVLFNTLTADEGRWNYSPDAFGYQWFRCSQRPFGGRVRPDGCAEITGETGKTYTQVAQDIGKYVIVSITNTNTAGSLTIWARTESTTDQQVEFLVDPSISGSPHVDELLTASAGEWIGYPSPSFSFQWYSCATEIFESKSVLSNGCEIIPQKKVIDFGVGLHHICLLFADGTIECSGYGLNGELGNGVFESSTRPVRVSGINNAIAISSGHDNNCALLADRTVKCWGATFEYRDSDFVKTATPLLVPGLTNVKAVSLSSFGAHACALLTDSTIKCWGSNYFGELGNGSNTNSLVPVKVFGIKNAVSISLGGEFSCALLAESRIKCWGYNRDGRLGNGLYTNSSTPVYVTGIIDATAVTVGDNFGCALTASKNSRCWGSDNNGQLGSGRTVAYDTPWPTLVNYIPNPTSLSASGVFESMCAIMADTSVSCWGKNEDGQLGDGTTKIGSNPVKVSNLFNVVKVKSAYNVSCALLVDYTVKCWGSNSYGQISSSSGETLLTPVSHQLTNQNLLVPSSAAGRTIIAGILASNRRGSVTRWTPSTSVVP